MPFETVTTPTMVAPSLYRRALPSSARVSPWQGRDGWTLRRFDWPADRATPRGSILFQAGRGDSFEKYLELFAHWHGLGWALTSFDWRGQGGSGRLGADHRVGHCGDYRPLVADLAAFWQEWQDQAQGPHVIVGHSMGGHLALAAMLNGAMEPDAAVLVAPMLGLRSPVGARAGEWAARAMARIGDPARPAWSSNERPATRMPRQLLLTHDADRYADERWWHGAAPELRLGPPSWGWLAEAFRATRAQRGDPRLGTLAVPVMMLVATADRLVDPGAAMAVAAKLPDVEILRFGAEAAHEILREADGVRDQAIAAIDRFLDARAPAA